MRVHAAERRLDTAVDGVVDLVVVSHEAVVYDWSVSMHGAQRVVLHVVEVDRRSRSQREVAVVVGLTSRAASAFNSRLKNWMRASCVRHPRH